MIEDYAPLVQNGDVWLVVDEDDSAGVIVLRIREDHLLVSNVAVATQFQGRGLGRQLLDHAERYAGEQGKDELRLYTNELMHENLKIYQRLGWEEYDRAEQDGFRRVFMRKKLALDKDS
jgi:ribosomal protein S18 acetylase RimI-like enzyme